MVLRPRRARGVQVVEARSTKRRCGSSPSCPELPAEARSATPIPLTILEIELQRQIRRTRPADGLSAPTRAAKRNSHGGADRGLKVSTVGDQCQGGRVRNSRAPSRRYTRR